MHSIGVIHGRFQPLHNDHMTYLLAGKERCQHLVIGVTNPDPLLTMEDSTDPARSTQEANPLSYFQRYVMIREALPEAGVTHAEFSVVPFPVNRPELYQYYVPLNALFILTIYDDWGRRKLKIFRSLGLETDVMWEKSPEEKGLTGSAIRRYMIRGEPWKHLVPASTAVLLDQWGIPDLLNRVSNCDTSASLQEK